MSDFQNLPNDQVTYHPVKPPFLVHEVSTTEFYIGTSRNFSDQSAPSWRIQKIWQDGGGVWNFGYPDGDQNFKYEWSARFGYTYNQ